MPITILHRPVFITFLQPNIRTNVHNMHVVQIVSKGRLTSHNHRTLPHHPGLRQPCHENPQPLETHPKPKKKQLTSLSNSCSLLLRCWRDLVNARALGLVSSTSNVRPLVSRPLYSPYRVNSLGLPKPSRSRSIDLVSGSTPHTYQIYYLTYIYIIH